MTQITALTVSEAIKSPSLAFGFINQDSPTTAKAVLGLQVIDLVKNLNVGKTMDQYQIAKTVNMILEDPVMRCLKPDDMKVCFDRMLKGYYGVNYDRIDTQTIFDTLNKYMEERQATVEEISIKQHELIKAGKMAEANPEGQKKVLEILKNAVKETKPEIRYKGEPQKTEPVKPEVKEKPKFQKSERDIFIQTCFGEFDKILKERGSLLKTGNFIEYNGKPVDQVEYVQLKVAEYDSTNYDIVKELKG